VVPVSRLQPSDGPRGTSTTPIDRVSHCVVPEDLKNKVVSQFHLHFVEVRQNNLLNRGLSLILVPLAELGERFQPLLPTPSFFEGIRSFSAKFSANSFGSISYLAPIKLHILGHHAKKCNYIRRLENVR